MAHSTVTVYNAVHKLVHLKRYYDVFMTDQLQEQKLGKTEAVYRQLKAEIASGRRPPGASLVEVKLVEETGASRTPVREALRRLAAEGLVELAPRMGAKVARLSLRSTRELFDYRRVLEPAAIGMVVAEARRGVGITARFSEIADQFTALQGKPHDEVFIERYRELATEFDLALIESTPNDHLARAIRELRPHTARLRQIAHAEHQRLDAGIAEHLAMCGHIVAGDAEAAVATLTEHLHHVDEAIFAAMMRSGQDSRTAAVDVFA